MARKLSVTVPESTRHVLSTSARRKVRTVFLKSASVTCLCLSPHRLTTSHARPGSFARTTGSVASGALSKMPGARVVSPMIRRRALEGVAPPRHHGDADDAVDGRAAAWRCCRRATSSRSQAAENRSCTAQVPGMVRRRQPVGSASGPDYGLPLSQPGRSGGSSPTPGNQRVTLDDFMDHPVDGIGRQSHPDVVGHFLDPHWVHPRPRGAE